MRVRTDPKVPSRLAGDLPILSPMIGALRARPWLLAAAAAAVVGVPVAAGVVLAGGQGGSPTARDVASQRTSGSEIDRLIARRQAGGVQAVEPSVGAPSQIVVQTETATDFPVPGQGKKATKGDGVSPGAPSDAEVRAQLRSLQREQKRVERLLLASGAPIRAGSGAFIWPVSGPITSPFCERRSWEACHPGIDIGVGTGTPIRAAQTGQVVLAGPQGGYGNFTCIGHSKVLSTCYAHQSQILVSVGQVVRQGEVIGLVGCTGLCFGAHLHFEVRVNGQVRNPLDYL
jgi:murein DD-endopeptidase MepM/ murein hydrolase activator NlpD